VQRKGKERLRKCFNTKEKEGEIENSNMYRRKEERKKMGEGNVLTRKKGGKKEERNDSAQDKSW
jgi:hypothetical protein